MFNLCPLVTCEAEGFVHGLVTIHIFCSEHFGIPSKCRTVFSLSWILMMSTSCAGLQGGMWWGEHAGRERVTWPQEAEAETGGHCGPVIGVKNRKANGERERRVG